MVEFAVAWDMKLQESIHTNSVRRLLLLVPVTCSLAPAIDSAMIRFSQRLAGILIGTSLAIVFTALFLPGMERIQEFELWIFGGFWSAAL